MKGIAYEKAVASVQAMMDPNSKVEHNVHIPDKDGIKRQFDVVVRGFMGGVSILAVLECKDQKRKVGVPQIEAFYVKSRSVGANAMIFVSRSGFAKTAITKAKTYGICPYSLLTKDKSEPLRCSVRWFMESYAWKQTSFSFIFESPDTDVGLVDCEQVYYGKHRLMDWWLKYLQSDLCNEEEDYVGELTFTKAREFTIKGDRHRLLGIICKASRLKRIYSKVVDLHFDGFYDWSKEKAKLPPSGTVQTGSLLSDFSDWEPYDGPLPPASGVLDLRLKGFLEIPLPYDQDVIDFSKL